jgi:hypothetical protein
MEIEAYEELIRRSTKGDKEATEALYSVGEELFIEGELAKAATGFKDAAISYRIAAFRNSAKLETSQKEAQQLIRDMDIFREWFLAFPDGQVALPKADAGVDKKGIEKAIYGEIKYPLDPEVSKIYWFLDAALAKSNEDFARLNGNRPVYVSEMLCAYFGIPSRRHLNLINASVDVRVGMDLLARKIEEKFSGQQQ